MEDKKLWHDAEKELPEFKYAPDKVAVVFTAYDEFTDGILLCMADGDTEFLYGFPDIYSYDDLYRANDPSYEEVLLPDHPVFYSVEIRGEQDGFTYRTFYVYDEPIRWAYAEDVKNYLKELSLSEE